MPFSDAIRIGAAGAGDYEVERSLRFNKGDNPVLTRSPSSTTDSTKQTLSFWFKISSLIDATNQGVMFAGGSDGSYAYVQFWNNTFYFGNSAGPYWNGNLILRDFSAWYHAVIVIDTTQSTANDRQKLYINGVQQERGGGSNPSEDANYEFLTNSSWTYYIGKRLANDMNFDGYMAEVNFVQGLALTPSSFAETDVVTGEYKPKKYTGGYGTNGFYLNFSDNSGTTATTLGKDSSGNGNNFTPNNFVTGDAVKDSPTNNFATLQMMGTPFESGASFSEGNLKLTTGSTNSARNLNRQAFAPFLVNSGKWYAEFMQKNSGTNAFIGVGPYQQLSPTVNNTRYAYVLTNNGNSYVRTAGSESISTYGSSIAQYDVLGIYLDMDAGTPVVYFSKNGQWADGSGNFDESSPTSGITLGDSFFTTDTGGWDGYGTFICSSASGGTSVEVQANFGQDSTFSGQITAGGNTDANAIGDFKYTVPTGAKALCTANLADPSIAEGDKHFNTLVFTGNQSTNARTGLDFQPDWVVYKALNPESGHGETKLHDSVRGSTIGQGIVQYNTSDPPAEVTNSSYLVSFDSNGLTVGSDGVYNNYQTYNQTGRNYQALCWKGGGAASSNGNGSVTSSVSVNASAGFSIVSWTSTGVTGSTIGHGLGVKPSCIILKGRNTSSTQPFRVYHSELGATKSLLLNTNDSESAQTGVWNDTEPTSSVFTVGSFGSVNENTKNYIAYCFSEVAGYSKFGSYTGNANNNGPFAYCGFEPAFLLIKRSSSGDTNPWIGYNNVRNPSNQVNNQMVWNTTQWENIDCDNCNLDFLSNGFKLRNSDGSFNGSGGTYVFLAFANSPFKYARAR